MSAQLKQASGVDLIVRGRLVYPGAGEMPIENGAVFIKDGKIESIGSFDLKTVDSATKIVGGENKLVMPGLVNAHTHLPMVLFRGLKDDINLMDWLQNYIWPAETRTVDEDMVYWTAMLALAESIRAGTTCLADGYFCQEGAAKAVSETGFRAVIGQGIIDFPAPGVPDPKRNLIVAEEFLQAGGSGGELLTRALFCHSPYTCGPETIRKAKELARNYEVPIFVHLAETIDESKIIKEKYGLKPAEYLDKNDFLDELTIAVHCVHLDDDVIDLLAERKTGVVTCPESNMKLASGQAKVNKWLKKGLKCALGTDGAGSNNDMNMFGEMRSLCLWHKAAEMNPISMPAEKALYMATQGGASVLGFENMGRLKKGNKADLITLDLDQPNLMPLYNIPVQLVYASSGGEVVDSVVNGRVLMEEKNLTTIDLEKVIKKVKNLSQKVRR